MARVFAKRVVLLTAGVLKVAKTASRCLRLVPWGLVRRRSRYQSRAHI